MAPHIGAVEEEPQPHGADDHKKDARRNTRRWSEYSQGVKLLPGIAHLGLKAGDRRLADAIADAAKSIERAKRHDERMRQLEHCISKAVEEAAGNTNHWADKQH